MSRGNLDRRDKERVDTIVRRAQENGEYRLDELFLSERVVKTISDEKILLEGYRESKLFSLLPFTPALYLVLCPMCVRDGSLASLDKFITSGRVIPVLLADFSEYPDSWIKFVTAHDYISPWEFRAFRYLQLTRNEDLCFCSSCASRMVKKAEATVTGRNAPRYSRDLDVIKSNLHPYLRPDAILLELATKACTRRRLSEVHRFAKMSFAIRQLRSAQVFDAGVLVDNDELVDLPANVSDAIDEVRLVSSNLKKRVAEGLSLNVPSDIPVDAFLEIVNDYQPRITNVINDVINRNDGAEEKVLRQVMAINAEIERIKGLKRHTVLEAAVGIAHDNRSLVQATLIGTALGTVSSVLGCAAAVGVGVKKFAQNRGLIKESAALQRLGRQIVRDAQPYTDEFLRMYFATSAPAIRVLSLRNRIATSNVRARAA